MKFVGVALALAASAVAFPSHMYRAIEENPELAQRAAEILEEYKAREELELVVKRQTNGHLPMFHAKQQFINVTGANKWVAPGPTDLRGPCPGLNAFANHNFLPHDGYATIQQFMDATQNVVGMGMGLSQFLSVYGAVIDGDLTAWSIAGPPPDSVYAPGAAPASRGQGISASHNKYESDVSPTRGDLYKFGDDYTLKVHQFQQMFNIQPNPKTANYEVKILGDFRYQRFQNSIATNPFFFNGPFTGVLVQPAAYTFIYRFMANHSHDHPEGILDQSVLKSWFSITGASGSFDWTPGYERIPFDWYRRALTDPYDQAFFFQDVATHAAAHPIFLSVGGNTGEVNTFTPVNIHNLTGGVYNAKTIKENGAFGCLAYEFAANAKPDVLLNSLDALFNAITPLTTALSCPELSNIDASQFGDYPGYNSSLYNF